EAPALRVLDIEIGTFDVHAVRGIVSHRVKPGLGTSHRAVVEGAAVAAIEAETVDEARLQVADEELLRRRIVGDVAETGAGIVLAVMGDVGEEGDDAGHAVDLPHRTGRAALVEAELAGHPARAGLALDQALSSGRDDLQAE